MDKVKKYIPGFKKGQENAAYEKDGTEMEKKEKSANYEGDENEDRGNWSHHFEFTLSCIAYAVGLGNIWRFPYMCYKYGGGAFVITYWILSALVGFPLIFFEQSIGQYTSQGPMHCWGFAPLARGLGFSMCALSMIGKNLSLVSNSLCNCYVFFQLAFITMSLLHGLFT